MARERIQILSERVQKEFLPCVTRPSRYIGGEVNQRKKDLASCDVTFALCFPDTYEVGMSNTGMGIIYDVLNNIEGVAAERVFAPWPDAEEVMRGRKLPLFTLESKAAVGDFDIIGFSISTELCYSNVLNMLDLANLPLRAKDRGAEYPVVIAGGAGANFCEPMADFIDLFVLGEAEEAVVALAELHREIKNRRGEKAEFLRTVAERFGWAYVPALYEFEYTGEKITSFEPLEDGLPRRFENAVVEDFENAPIPTRPIVPFAEAVQERVSIEIMRGCPGRCRFCQASFCRRPIRYRSVDCIFDAAKTAWRATGFDTVSLLSLSTGEYPRLGELVVKLQEYFESRYVGLSVPSLRVDQQLELIPRLVGSVRKPGLTMAVEAAGERLRRVINKPLSEEELFSGIEAAWRAGFGRVKLYFMVGLPGETEEDIRRIVELCKHAADLRTSVAGRPGQVNVTISWLVGKPHTPFGWLGQKSRQYLQQAREIILSEKRGLRAHQVHFKFHDIGRSVLEAAVARGDRRLGRAIERAYKAGARFCLWDECFDYGLWQEAFAEEGFDLEAAATRNFAEDEVLPWEHLGGPPKKYLLGHLHGALEAANS